MWLSYLKVLAANALALVRLKNRSSHQNWKQLLYMKPDQSIAVAASMASRASTRTWASLCQIAHPTFNVSLLFQPLLTDLIERNALQSSAIKRLELSKSRKCIRVAPSINLNLDVIIREMEYKEHTSYKTFYPFQNKHPIHWHLQSVKIIDI